MAKNKFINICRFIIYYCTHSCENIFNADQNPIECTKIYWIAEY